MAFILFGPPGSGKGTQAELLTKEFKLVHISTGNMLRQAVKSGSKLGSQVESIMREGKLVPDEVVAQLVKNRLEELETGGRECLLDGYPRNRYQADQFDGILREVSARLSAVLSLEVPEAVLLRRLSGRRVCSACGAMFNVFLSNPPRVEGKCDRCGGDLFQRADDQEETIRERLRVYQDETEPLLKFYDGRGSLRRVKGEGNAQDVFARVEPLVKRAMAGGA
ncbi:MAG: adenylate kinase [bacterium]